MLPSISVQRCWTVATRRSDGAAGTVRWSVTGRRRAAISSTTRACSCRSLALDKRASPTARSSASPSPRRAEPARGVARTADPRVATSSSGVAPMKADSPSCQPKTWHCGLRSCRWWTISNGSIDISALMITDLASTTLRRLPDRMASTASPTASHQSDPEGSAWTEWSPRPGSRGSDGATRSRSTTTTPPGSAPGGMATTRRDVPPLVTTAASGSTTSAAGNPAHSSPRGPSGEKEKPSRSRAARGICGLVFHARSNCSKR